MYYSETCLSGWLIKKSYEDDFVFGPFVSEGDAYFIVEMLNSEKLSINVGELHGQESS
jgi:hypothetical protein